MSRRRYAAASIAAAVSCSSCAPLFPIVDPVKAGTINYIDIQKLAASQQLQQAQEYARNTESEFASQGFNVNLAKNVEILGLVGVGAGAGVNAVKQGSKGQLQTFALVAAGLVGLDQVFKFDSQFGVFNAGRAAVICLIGVDGSLEKLRDAVSKNPGVKRMENVEEFKQVNSSLAPEAATQQALQLLIQDEQLKFAEEYGKAKNKQDTVRAFNSMNTLALVRAASNSTADLVKAAKDASSDGSRAAVLADGVFQIRSAVANQLYKLQDVSTIYAAMNNALNKKTADVVKKKNQADAQITLALDASAPATSPDSISSLVALSAVSQPVLDAANDVQSKYDDCIKQATVAPPQNPASNK